MTRRRFDSVWDAIERSPDAAKSLKLRAEIAHGILAEVERRKLHFPPSEIARIRLAPGARAPDERRRRARVRLEAGGSGCTVRGKAWADATNASGLESFSDQTRFEYSR